MQRHGGCLIITYGKQVEYQREAGYHVETERMSGSKPEGCHATERAESEQPVQAPEEPEDAVSSCGHVDPLEERLATNGWRTLAAPDATKRLSGQFLSWALQARVRRKARVFTSAVSVERSCSVTEGRKLVELILKGQGLLHQTSVAILNIDTDVTDKMKWRLCKAAQQLQIPLDATDAPEVL